jgi:hypothetical protein
VSCRIVRIEGHFEGKGLSGLLDAYTVRHRDGEPWLGSDDRAKHIEILIPVGDARNPVEDNAQSPIACRHRVRQDNLLDVVRAAQLFEEPVFWYPRWINKNEIDIIDGEVATSDLASWTIEIRHRSP